MAQFAVIGLGRFGRAVAHTLSTGGGEVVAIDIDMAAVQGIEDTVTQAVRADATSREAIASSGTPDVDCAVICIGENLEASVLSALILKELGVPRIIARAKTRAHADILRRIGVDEVVMPEEEMGENVAYRVLLPGVRRIARLAGNLELAEATAGNAFTGKTIGDLDVRKRYGVSIVSLRSAGNGEEKLPGAADAIRKGDRLVLLGPRASVSEFGQRVSE
jgi:trk system potassium uptake protein TrkA